MGTELAEQVPINVVGSSTFGIYPKISKELTYNMFITDEWLCNYAGYQLVNAISAQGEGRGLFRSMRGGFMLAVINNTVYLINSSLSAQPNPVTLSSTQGEVFMDENLSQQICIVDGTNAYIYHYDVNNPGTMGQLTLQALQQSGPLAIIPNYVTYHNTFFLIGSAPNSINPQNWYAFIRASDTTITINPGVGGQFALQTKPDRAIAIKRLPGLGNNIIVMGQAVCEVWNQVGGTQNYQRLSTYNIDNGVVSVSTIAANEEMVCWLSQNENNSPSIMVSTGNQTKRISTDGIDNLLESIKVPAQSTAFFYRQNGHVFYHLTFFNPLDNLSLIYDFTTDKFFHVANEDMNFYPARQVANFNDNNYFVSLKDASLYQIGQQFKTYNYDLDVNARGEEIPRIRICKSIRKTDSATFRCGLVTFWIEQGIGEWYNIDNSNCDGLLITEDTSDYIITESGEYILSETGICFNNNNRPRVDLSFSKNGNQSFSNIVSRELNEQAKFRNQIRWHRIGQGNELTFQFRFWGFQRFVVQNGVAEIY